MMRPLLYILPVLLLIPLAFWAYHENYATQRQLKELARLQRDIGQLRDEIAMQKAEWAYLNRPARLRDLASVNFDRLGLLPIEPSQLAQASEVVMPPAAPLVVTGTTINASAPEDEQIP
jgi:hypothetical protein